MASGSGNIALEPTNAQESQVAPIPSHLEVFNAILRALLQIDFFKDELSKDEETSIGFRGILLQKIVSPSGELMDNTTGISSLYTKIIDNLPFMKTFKISRSMKKTCCSCKNLLGGSDNVSGEIIAAGYLNDLKSMVAFKDLKFETIFTTAKVASMITCPVAGCGEKNFIEHTITKLPSVFTLFFCWIYNEDETDIRDTLSVLKPRIDLTAIYKYEGDSPSVNYDLVSMVCTQEDHQKQERGQYMYFYVANERGKWVRPVGVEEQITIGEDWESVVSKLAAEYIRPEMLFFEQVKVSIPPSTSSVVPKPTEASSSSADLKGKGIAMD